MSIRKIQYNGSSKVILRLCEIVNALIDQGSGGSNVSITPSLSFGTKVADYSIDDVPGVLYAPTPPTVHNVPDGGYTNQVLAKNSRTDYDMSWVSLPSPPEVHNVPSGGAANQVLTKNSGGDYDMKWADAPKTHPIQTVKLTLDPLLWQGTEPPYRYDLGTSYENRNASVGLNGTAITNNATIELIGKFMIVGGESGRYLYALQWHPSVDIPVIVQYSEEG